MAANIVVHTDGASRGNPGQASIAYVIEGLEEKPVESYLAIGIYSNNQAEYRALLSAVTFLSEANLKNRELDFFADSELMIKQINGEYRVKDELLKPLYLEIKGLVSKMEDNGNSFNFFAVRRAENKRADELANIALDSN